MAESREQLWPAGELSSHGNGGDQCPSCCSDEGRGITNGQDGFLFNEALDLCRKAGIVDLGIILEYEASNGSCRLILCLHLSHHITHHHKYSD